MFKRLKIILFSVLLMTSLTVPCSAADEGIQNLFENAFYGGLAGALVGTACLAFTKTPSDHLDYISIGAASGVILGVGYSVAQGSRSLISFKNGTIKVAMPTITPELQTTGIKGQSSLMLKAELIGGSF